MAKDSTAKTQSSLEPQLIKDDSTTIKAFKTYDDIKSHYDEKVKKIPDTELILTSATDSMRDDLLAYYRSPQGKRDIAKSIHSSREPEEIVELLMLDVYYRENEHVLQRGAKLKMKAIEEKRNKDAADTSA